MSISDRLISSSLLRVSLVSSTAHARTLCLFRVLLKIGIRNEKQKKYDENNTASVCVVCKGVMRKQ